MDVLITLSSQTKFVPLFFLHLMLKAEFAKTLMSSDTFDEVTALRDLHLSNNPLSVLSVVSAAHCGYLCHSDNVCNVFSYNVNSHLCKTYSDTSHTGITDDGWHSYVSDAARKNCPEHLGYSHEKETFMCLKLVTSTVSFQAAKNSCLAENASLVKIDSSITHQAVFSFASGLQSFTHVYVQGGRNPGNSNEWLFDDGTVISYLPWDYGEPQAADQVALLMMGTSPGNFRDTYSSTLSAYICQIVF